MNCKLCQYELRSNAHHNTMYCDACRITARKKRKPPNFTDEQKEVIMSMAGKARRQEIANKAGVNISALKLFCLLHRINLRWTKYNPDVVDQVIAHYEKFGRVSTKERFPQVKVRTIIETNPHERRFPKWTDKQIRQCAVLSGLIDRDTLAKYLNRKNTYIGSIDALINRRLRAAPKTMHGISLTLGRRLLRPGFPSVVVGALNKKNVDRRIVLWCDVVNWLLPQTPKVIIDAFASMALFQKTLFRGKDPRICIPEIVRRLKNGQSLD